MSEPLREPKQEGAALTELRGADTDALAVADLVAVVEQIDDVETQVRRRAEPDGDLLHQRSIDRAIFAELSSKACNSCH